MYPAFLMVIYTYVSLPIPLPNSVPNPVPNPASKMSLITYLLLGILIAYLDGNKPLCGTGERPRGPDLSIHHEYIEGYLRDLHRDLGSAASVGYGPLWIIALCPIQISINPGFVKSAAD
jgi:hypothetical protein